MDRGRRPKRVFSRPKRVFSRPIRMRPTRPKPSGTFLQIMYFFCCPGGCPGQCPGGCPGGRPGVFGRVRGNVWEGIWVFGECVWEGAGVIDWGDGSCVVLAGLCCGLIGSMLGQLGRMLGQVSCWVAWTGTLL